MDDRVIVQMFLDRNEDAIAEAKRRYGDYITYIAGNVLHDRQDAEECLNDVLYAAWESIPPQEPNNLRTYLGKLTRETAIDRWRTKNRKKRVRSDVTVPLDEIGEMVSGGDLGAALEEKELAREISRFLRQLDETKRRVFIRRYWYYDSVKSICVRYGFGKSRVFMMLKRTRKDLVEYLKERGLIG